jgi:hypothetical protein
MMHAKIKGKEKEKKKEKEKEEEKEKENERTRKRKSNRKRERERERERSLIRIKNLFILYRNNNLRRWICCVIASNVCPATVKLFCDYLREFMSPACALVTGDSIAATEGVGAGWPRAGRSEILSPWPTFALHLALDCDTLSPILS